MQLRKYILHVFLSKYISNDTIDNKFTPDILTYN